VLNGLSKRDEHHAVAAPANNVLETAEDSCVASAGVFTPSGVQGRAPGHGVTEAGSVFST